MTFKKILIISLFLISFPVGAKECTNRLDYMNMDWWKNYNDEVLIRHFQTLYENNHDLRIAALKTKQAEENIRLAGANQLPQLGFDGSVSRVFRGPRTQFGSVVIPKYIQNEIFLPLNASYEIDIWGQNYLNRKSAKKQAEIAKQQERAAYIYITSSFAADYYNLIKMDELERNLLKIIDLQKNIVSMTEKKYNSGLASINEVLDEKQILVNFEKDLNKLKENKKILNDEAVVLLGLNTDKAIELSDYQSISFPQTPETLSTTIIQFRPDLISSEDYVKKSGIDVRVARRDFLPKFILYGNLGFNAYKWNRMFAGETFLANAGIAPRWDIFTGGIKMARYRINKYEYKKAVEIYEKTVLTSIQEVNDALAEAKTTKANLIKSDEDYSIEKEKHILAEKQFSIGDSSMLDEMKSEVNLYVAKQRNIAAKIDNVISSISLYNVVGGIDYTKNDL
ncbi:nodT family efflux transporter outer membrane factor (OMF) lipoprotein [Acinetobacter sp. CAG:196]|nr:nodT family efflux transporter outer membrane factor (OMF) lipoprotein [Acinetobacter sp. CAG:196]DAB15529.1 MAG TPA: TolC family protein [Candidatus Gastranaerophilales bacterium HUM_18]